MKKNIPMLIAVLAVAFSIGLAITPGVTELAYAGLSCPQGQSCAYADNCFRYRGSCSACLGGECMEEYDNTCSDLSSCCGLLLNTVCL